MYSRANGQFSVVTAGEIIGEIFRLVDAAGNDYMTLGLLANWPGYAFGAGPALEMHHGNPLYDSALAWNYNPTGLTGGWSLYGPRVNPTDRPPSVQSLVNEQTPDKSSDITMGTFRNNVSGGGWDGAEITLVETRSAGGGPGSRNAQAVIEASGDNDVSVLVGAKDIRGQFYNYITIRPYRFSHRLTNGVNTLNEQFTLVYLESATPIDFNLVPTGALVTDSLGYNVYINSAGLKRTVYSHGGAWAFPFSNGTLGNGTWEGQYRQSGDTITARGEWTFGSTSAVGAFGMTLDLPTAVDWPMSGWSGPEMATITYTDPLGVPYVGYLKPGNSLGYGSTPSGYLVIGTVDPTEPFTWATGSQITVTVHYIRS